MGWNVIVCEDCNKHFAIKEEPAFHICSFCGSEETVGTGEHLSSQLYTEDGRKI